MVRKYIQLNYFFFFLHTWVHLVFQLPRVVQQQGFRVSLNPKPNNWSTLFWVSLFHSKLCANDFQFNIMLNNEAICEDPWHGRSMFYLILCSLWNWWGKGPSQSCPMRNLSFRLHKLFKSQRCFEILYMIW